MDTLFENQLTLFLDPFDCVDLNIHARVCLSVCLFELAL